MIVLLLGCEGVDGSDAGRVNEVCQVIESQVESVAVVQVRAGL